MASNIVERVPPQAIDAEMALIGAMLIEKEAIEKAIDIVAKEDFYKDIHKQIFENIIELYNLSQPVDYITLSDRLNKNGLFAQVGGAFYLTSMIDTVQTAANVEQYAAIIRDKSILRQLISAGSEIVNSAFNEKLPPEEILDNSQSKLLKISDIKENKGFAKIGDIGAKTVEMLAKRHENKNDIPGLSTGFADLDGLTAGLQPAELIIIAARPSMGKTAFVLNIAQNIAITPKSPLERKAVGIFSLEMVSKELLLRLLSSISGVNAQGLRKGNFREADFPRITDSMRIISDAPIYIDDSATKIMDVLTRSRKLHRELLKTSTPLSLIVIDYLQLMQGNKHQDNKVLEIGDISRSLKILSKDLNIPVVVLSQLNRGPEKGRKDNRPMLSDLRDSGAIEQDADVVMFIHRDFYYNHTDLDKEREATLIIGKQRNGPVGDINLYFDGKTTRFSDAEKYKTQH